MANAGSLTFYLDEAGTKANISGLVKIVSDIAAGIKPIKLKFEGGDDPTKILGDISRAVTEISEKSMEMNISLSASTKNSTASMQAYRDQIKQVGATLQSEINDVQRLDDVLSNHKNSWGDNIDNLKEYIAALRQWKKDISVEASNNPKLFEAESINKLSGDKLDERARVLGEYALRLKELYSILNQANGKNIANVDELFKPEKAASSSANIEKITQAIAASVAPSKEVQNAMEGISKAGLPNEQFEKIVAPLDEINKTLQGIVTSANEAKISMEGTGNAGQEAASQMASAEKEVADAIKQRTAEAKAATLESAKMVNEAKAQTEQAKQATEAAKQETEARKQQVLETKNAAEAYKVQAAQQKASAEATKAQREEVKLATDQLKQRSAAEKLSAQEANMRAKAERDVAKATEQAAKEEARAAKEAEQTENRRLSLLKQVRTAIGAVQSDLKKMSGSQGTSEYKSLENELTKLIGLENKLSEAGKGGFDTSKINDATRSYKTITAEVQKLRNEIRGSSTDSLNFFNSLGAAFKSQLSYMFGAAAIARQAIQYTKEMIDAAIELDSAMTQLKIVTNETDDAYVQYSDSLSKTAQKVGSSISELTDSATVYARLGYSLGESESLAEYTAMLQNVGDIDVASAQAAVTAIVKAYGKGANEIEGVMDRLVAVGNNYPISVAELAEGMNNAGSALASSNNSFEESIALLTAANTTVQDISKSSTGLRTIAARIQKVNTILEEDGEALTEAKYEELVSALTNAGVAITDANGEFRSTYAIIKDIAGVWGNLTSLQQSAIMETLGGNRQRNVLASLIGQFQEAEGAMITMSKSEGELTRANGIYMESVQAHLNQFKAAWQGIASDLFSADSLNYFIDIGTGALNAVSGITKLTDALGGLKTIIPIVSTLVVSIKAIKTALAFTGGAHLAGGAAGLSISSIFGAMSPLGKITVAVSALMAVAAIIDKIVVTSEEHLEKARELETTLTSVKSEYEQLKEKNIELVQAGEQLSEAEQNRLIFLEAQKEALEEQIKLEKQSAYEQWKRNMQSKTQIVDGKYVTDEGGNSYYTEEVRSITKYERNLRNIGNRFVEATNKQKAGTISLEAYRKQLAQIISDEKERYDEYKQYEDAGFDLDEDAKKFIDTYESIEKIYGRLGEESKGVSSEIASGLEKSGDAAAETAGNYNILRDAITNAEEALAKFNEAIKSDKGDTAKNYADAYEKVVTAINEGKIGSNAIRAGIELFIPEEVQRGLNYDVNELSKLLSGGIYKALFGTEGENYGAKFIDYIRSDYEQLKDIVTFADLGEGAYEFGYTSLSELANALGLTEDAMAALLDALNLYGVNVLHSKEETDAFANQLGLLSGIVASTPASIQAVANDIAKMDKSLGAFDILEWLNTLESANYIDLSQVRDQIGSIVGAAISSRDAVSDAKNEAEELGKTDETATVGVDGVESSQTLMDNLYNTVVSFGLLDETATVTINTKENRTVTSSYAPASSYLSSPYNTYYKAAASGTSASPGGKTMLNELGEEVVIEGNEAFVYGGGRPTVANLPKGAIVLNAEETAEAFDNRGKKKLVKSAATGTKLTDSVNSPYNTYYVKATPKTKTCPNCGTGNLAESVRWCPSCGYDFTTGDVPVKSPTQTYIPPTTTTTTTTGGGGGGGSSSSSSSKKEETWFERQYKDHKHARAMDKESEQEYLDWLKGAYQQAYNEGIITLDDFYKYQEEVYKGLHDLFKDSLSDKEFEIAALEKQGDQAAQIYNIYQQLIGDVNNEIQKAYNQGLTNGDSYVQELYKQLWGYKDKAEKLYDSLADDAKSNLDDLIKYRMKMLKKELEDEKKSYNERLDAFNDFINKQKDLLSDVADEEDHLTEQAEKRKAVTDLEAQIAQLEYDDSAKAQKKRLELQEQLTAARNELAKFERDYAIEQAQDQLDKIYDITESAVNKQTELIDKKLEDQQYLYETALRDVQINGQWLYDEMVAYEKRYGEGNEFPIVKMWEEAYVALGNYAQLYGQLYKGINLQNVTGYNGTFTRPGGYASGTSSATPGLHRLFEHGDEYIFKSSNGNSYHMFSGGEKVLDAGATDFIYNFARSRGFASNLISGFGSSIRNINNSATNSPVIQMGDIIIQGSANESTVSEIRREQRSGIDYLLKEFKKLNK